VAIVDTFVADLFLGNVAVIHRDQHAWHTTSLKFFSIREAIFLVLANNLPRFWIFDRDPYVLCRWAGIRVAGKCMVYGPLTVRPYGGCGNITIGEGTFLNVSTSFCVVYDVVRIGARVQVGPRVSFETMGHTLAYIPGKGRGRTSAPIVVEDEAWLGAGVTLLEGVTIGRGAVVAAGAVVTKDVPSYTLVGGVPARTIRPLGRPDASPQSEVAAE
jgi:maltose O-acetyltransferase